MVLHSTRPIAFLSCSRPPVHLRTIQRLLVRLSGSTTAYWWPASAAAPSPAPGCCCSAAVCWATRPLSGLCKREARGQREQQGDQELPGWRQRQRRRRRRLVGSSATGHPLLHWTHRYARRIGAHAKSTCLSAGRRHVGRQPCCPLHTGLQAPGSGCGTVPSVVQRARDAPSREQGELRDGRC